MATWNDVRKIVKALPETKETTGYGTPHWKVKDQLFAWDRPLRKRDLEELGDAAPKGPVLGIRTHDLSDKDVLLAGDPKLFFTTSHFDGYPAVLVRLEKIRAPQLKTLLIQAWKARAPKKVLAQFEGKTNANAPRKRVTRAASR